MFKYMDQKKIQHLSFKCQSPVVFKPAYAKWEMGCGFFCMVLLCIPTVVRALCLDGHFQSSTGVCSLCPVGYECPNDDFDDKIACKPGSFQPMEGELQCLECPAYSYSSLAAQSQCQLCDVSYDTPRLAQTLNPI